MKKAQATIVSLVACAAMIGALGAAGEDFYVTRLKAGEGALRAQRPVDAIDQLRIANFGLLERPPLLEEGLIYLSLAYAQAERSADVDAALTRFVEVENRFGVYTNATLDSDAKASFEDLLRRRVRAEVLAQIPALAHLFLEPPPKKKAEKKK